MKIRLGHHDIILTPSGAIWLPALKLLCVADLHFEKASFFSRFATFLPPYDNRENLKHLKEIVNEFQPDIFVALGDSFHDRDAVQRMPCEYKEALNKLVGQVAQWYWLIGNHDPNPSLAIQGARRDELHMDRLHLRHQALPAETGMEISGHYHPKARVKLRGHTLTGACFVHNQQRLILPSFGLYTGGLDVRHDAFAQLFPVDDRYIGLIYQGEVFDMGLL